MSIGISKKVHAELEEFQRRGYITFYSAYCKKGISIFNNEGKELYHHKCKVYDGGLGHWIRRMDNIECAKKFLIKNPVDLVYMRFHFWDVYTLGFIKTIKKNNPRCKIIVEAHSYPYKSQKPSSKFYKVMYLLDDLFSRKVKKYVDLVAAVSDIDVNIWGCKTIRIENGINTDSYEVRTIKVHDNSLVNLLCVANETPPHGIDRVIKGMAIYNGDVNVILYLIGEYSETTKKMVSDYKLEKSVRFVGKRSGEELNEYYSLADLGIGLMAGHRINYHQGICLKTKEYFSVGLPFITAASKSALVNDLAYVLVFDENENAIDIDRVIKFAFDLRGNKEIPKQMNYYAKQHYSWKTEMDKVFNCLS